MDGKKSLGDRAMDAAARLAWGHDGKQWSDEDVHEAGCLLVELRDALAAREALASERERGNRMRAALLLSPGVRLTGHDA
jgi:hypothetical protein